MITARHMRELEKRCAEKGIPSSQLMENAGHAVVGILRQRFHIDGKKVLICTYHGNNSGDGFVIARLLSEFCPVHVHCVGDVSKMREDTLSNFQKLPKEMLVAKPDIGHYDILVDAMLGIGFTGDLSPQMRQLLSLWDSSFAVKVAVDIPTGIPADGGPTNAFFDPDFIVTFHDMKPGLLPFQKKTVVVDIGIPQDI
jgi:NAD(P)H-hydrate epimerase